MLRTRVIPVVLLNGHSVIKTIKFDVRRNLGNPITVARVYNTRNVDELILLDIDASKQGRSIDLFTVADVASECFMPLAVGGGIRSLDDIRTLLRKGADKVVINTAALLRPDFIAEAAAEFGSQCIVVSIDVLTTTSGYVVRSLSHIPPDLRDPFKCSKIMENMGAGEIFLNFVDRDGEMCGVDQEFVWKFTSSLGIPVIACGGISSPEDGVSLAKAGASGIAAASIFHFTSFTPHDCKVALNSHGIAVRQ